MDSLYSQTIVPDEVVVCDDCSKDGTADVLEEYHQKYGLRYYVNESNLGVNKNFEKAIRLCSSSYIAICDQDDVWFPLKIEILLKKMMAVENGQPCVVSSKTIPFAGILNECCYEQVENDSVGAGHTLLRAGNVQGCTLMMNRKMIDLLKPFPASYKEVMMYDCYISFVAASCGIKYNIGQALMAYRRHDSNVLGKIHEKKPFMSRVVAKMRMLKYDRIFPSSRCYTLKYIYDEYRDVMHDDAKDIIQDVYEYCSRGLLKRMEIIASLNVYEKKEKLYHLVMELLMSMVPINKMSRG